MPACDVDNMVFGCFKGGSYGFAMRYLLLRSRGTIQSGYYEPRIRSDGAAHRLCTRSGLCKPDIVEQGYDYGIYPMMGMLGAEMPTIDAWYKPIGQRMHDGIHGIISELVHDCDDQTGTWVWVDHISPSNARSLFPKARLFAMRMDANRSFRNYAIKNRFEHTDDIAMRGRTGITTIDELVENEFGSYKRKHYKKLLRDTMAMLHSQKGVIDDEADVDGLHTVDAVRLFHSKDWEDEYLRLCAHCGLEPNIDAAGSFIREYASLQYDRSTYSPDPTWKWTTLIG